MFDSMPVQVLIVKVISVNDGLFSLVFCILKQTVDTVGYLSLQGEVKTDAWKDGEQDKACCR